MELIDKFSVKGINSHLIWIYGGNERVGGINRNNDVLKDKYYCFENYGYGECRETIWYPNLEAARKVLDKYLSREISNIPVKVC